INQCKITKNLSQNVVHSDPDLILHNSSVLIDKEPKKINYFCKRSAKIVCFFILPLFSYLLGEKIRLNSKKFEDTI
ncbi:hypothetical protein ACYIK4_09370, partial [Enterococcus faecium]